MNHSRLYRRALIVGAIVAGGTVTVIGLDGSVAAGRSNGIASKSPTQILNAAQVAVKSAHSYVLTAEFKQSGSTMGVDFIYGGARQEFGVVEGQTAVNVILASGHAYMQANAYFWRKETKSSATARLAGLWIELPASSYKKALPDLGDLEPTTFADCLSHGPHGIITKLGTTTLGGMPAVVLKDAGNVPGDGPGTIAIATTGPAYPVQLVATGPTRAGGKVNACNDGKGSSQTGTIRFDDFDHAPAIKIPVDPIKLPTTSHQAV